MTAWLVIASIAMVLVFGYLVATRMLDLWE